MSIIAIIVVDLFVLCNRYGMPSDVLNVKNDSFVVEIFVEICILILKSFYVKN